MADKLKEDIAEAPAAVAALKKDAIPAGEKKEQLLIIAPAYELKFCGPFNQAITSHMRLSNPTDKKILFKIKTTAPKKYCVRPNCGTLEPSATVEVSICLQPFVYDPQEKNKHKFMVQSLVANAEGPFEKLWKDISTTELMDSKLKCVFEMPKEITKLSPSNKATSDSTGNIEFIYSESNAQSTGLTSADLNQTADSGAAGGISSGGAGASATPDVKQLRADALKLRLENVALQEENQRLRYNSEAAAANKSGGSGAAFQNQYKPPQLSQAAPLSPVYLVATLAIAIVAMLLGKFIL